jgi:hypothetical protein
MRKVGREEPVMQMKLVAFKPIVNFSDSARGHFPPMRVHKHTVTGGRPERIDDKDPALRIFG